MKPNYQFEKRRRDMEKKAKKEEKKKKKLQGATGLSDAPLTDETTGESSTDGSAEQTETNR